MPTISEPLGPEKEAKIEAIIQDYMQGIDNDEVFKARLFGQGLRGAELARIHYGTLQTKYQASAKVQGELRAVLVLEVDGTSSTIRFNTPDAAGKAVELLRRQPNVRFACRVGMV